MVISKIGAKPLLLARLVAVVSSLEELGSPLISPIKWAQ
jgi:hypothetical protein